MVNVNTQLLSHNVLAICTYNPHGSVTITCGIQPTCAVTMVIKVLPNTCNMSKEFFSIAQSESNEQQ